MKYLLACLLVIQTTPLTNKDVLDMLASGLSPTVVAAKIKTSPGAYDTSPATLLKLKEAGVPDAVVVAMVEATTPKTEEFVTIPDGTPVSVVMTDTVSSESAAEGDPLSLKVDEDVVVNKVVVIKKGAIAKGSVTEAEASGGGGKPGVLAIELTHVVAADGSRVRLRAEKSSKGKDLTARQGALTEQGNRYAWRRRGGKAAIREGVHIPAYTDGEAKVKVGH